MAIVGVMESLDGFVEVLLPDLDLRLELAAVGEQPDDSNIVLVAVMTPALVASALRWPCWAALRWPSSSSRGWVCCNPSR
jgi:hypothetical protein